VRIVRAALSCSLAALLALAVAGPYRDLSAKVHAASTQAEKLRLIGEADVQDAELQVYVDGARASDPNSVQKAVDYVDLRAQLEGSPTVADQAAAAKKIGSNPLYQQSAKPERANWLSGAIKRLENVFKRREQQDSGEGFRPEFAPPATGAGFLIYFVWFLLAAILIAFIVYALRFVQFGKLRSRKAKAMLDDDEPERTLDEWLALASQFEAEGKYREAVRALYLACLLKFDEKNVARFLRGQTNWEHLNRIESSPKKPAGLDFRSPTQAFDQIWYGHKVRGAVDVEEFRGWYSAVTDSLATGVAA
jgi:hypothetical protein